jgi:hypothetical protein
MKPRENGTTIIYDARLGQWNGRPVLEYLCPVGTVTTATAQVTPPVAA